MEAKFPKQTSFIWHDNDGPFALILHKNVTWSNLMLIISHFSIVLSSWPCLTRTVTLK
jgi:hypothetical protein